MGLNGATYIGLSLSDNQNSVCTKYNTDIGENNVRRFRLNTIQKYFLFSLKVVWFNMKYFSYLAIIAYDYIYKDTILFS